MEYNAATINGGYLRGPGTHVALPGTTNNFNGVTTYNSTVFQQNGTDNFTNFTNGGQVVNNAVLNWNGGTNNGTGSLVVNNTVNVQDWGNQGVVTVNSGGTLNNAVSDLVSYGAAPDHGQSRRPAQRQQRRQRQFARLEREPAGE